MKNIKENNTFSQTFLPDSTWSNVSDYNRASHSQKNQLFLKWETKIDSTNTIKFAFGASEQEITSNSFSKRNVFSDSKNINANYTVSTDKNKSRYSYAYVLWMHKFKKMRHTLSVKSETNNNNSKNRGYLYSENLLYKNGLISLKDTIDQQKTNNNNSKNYSTNINYTEPLSKNITASLEYEIEYQTQDDNQTSFDKDIMGKYTITANLYTNNFLLNTISHQPKLGFNIKIKKSTINISSKLGINEFNQFDKTNNIKRNYKFNNLNSNLNFNTKFKNYTTLYLSYNGNASAPSINQLQPILDNSDPLEISVGNPNLKQSFSHFLNGQIGNFNMFTNRDIFSYFNASFRQNAFTQFSEIDTLGRTIFKTVNVNGLYNMNMYLDYGFKWKKPGISFNITPEFAFIKYADFINSQKNISNNNSYGLGVSISKPFGRKGNDEESEVVYLNLRNDIKYNQSKASINKATNTNFWSFNGDYSIYAKITKKLTFNTGIEVELRQKDPRFPRNNNFNLWNANLERTIVKDKWLLSVGVKDILKQNRGFNRSFVGYNYTENFYITLQRYYMVTITHKFNTQKAKTNAKK